MRTPDYIIIGAPKCGTTSLFEYIGKHPDVINPKRKEINYFSRGYNRRTRDWYMSWFKDVPAVQGEATPKYFYDIRAINLIKRDLPGIKLILMLRDPVERAYSNYWWAWKTDTKRVKELGETAEWSFEQVLENELENFSTEWPKALENIFMGDFSFWLSRYAQLLKGHYAYWLNFWLREFNLDKDLLVINSNQFFRDENTQLSKVFKFLDLKPYKLSQTELKDRTPGQKYPNMKEETRKFLVWYYRKRNQELYTLIGRDLGWQR